VHSETANAVILDGTVMLLFEAGKPALGQEKHATGMCIFIFRLIEACAVVHPSIGFL
jgi:hypothetical protein